MRNPRSAAVLIAIVLAGSVSVALTQRVDLPRYDRVLVLEPTSETSANVHIGDVNADGKLDIVLAKGRHWPLADRVLLGDGRGAFPTAYDLGPASDRTYSGNLVDLDGDGDLDVVISNDAPDVKRIYLNDGSGRFRQSGTYGRAGWPTRNAAVADVNGDRLPDIITANRTPPGEGGNYICLNRGKGLFEDECTAFSRESATTISAGDFNRDGRVDLVVPHRDGGQSHVYMNESNAGALRFTPVAFGPSDATIRVSAAVDLNRDGRIDIVAIDEKRGVFAFFGERPGVFSNGVPIGDRRRTPYALIVADLNRDGAMDIVVGHVEAASTVFFNEGSGRTFRSVDFGDGKGTVYGFDVADLDNDRRLDIAAARSDAPNVVYFADGPDTAQPAEASRIRDAATRGYAAIQVAQKASRASQTCTTTCHLQVYGAFAYRAMRDHGLALDENVARADAERAFRRFMTGLSGAVEASSLGEIAMNQAFFLVASHELGLRPSVVTAAVARSVALKQNPEGDWPALRERPPSNYSPFTFTALALRALQLYGHPGQKADLDRRIARARAWLQSHEPRETEERTYQLLGLRWAGAAPNQIAPRAAALAGTQRADGGWNSLAGRDSDVYSTAQALVALHEAGGMPATDGVWRRGLEFLLRAQAPDGTWHVKTRLPPWVSPPYFESGYPYGRDQFISVAGATWSIRALALALGQGDTSRLLPLADVRPGAIDPWVETVMFGSVADLRALIDKGFDPNTATEVEQLTPLMLAMPDAGKVKLLIDRGARLDTVSRLRYSALLIGAQYRESTAALRLLLARGAGIAASPADAKPAADAYPTFFASHAGNAEILPDLLRAGDALDAPSMMFGAAPVPPLLAATYFSHIDAGRALIELGARVDPSDGRYDSPLASAIFANDVEFARLLIKAGANVNRVDEEGRTPLMYAAVADFGDTALVDLLLASGARTGVRDKQGLTALDHARQFGHAHLTAKLTP